jgi:hypothetical protein
MKTTGRKIGINGKEYTMTSEAWWLDNAVQLPSGKVEVARVHGEDGKGKYLLCLTDEDINVNNICPGTFASAFDDVYAPTSKPKQKVMTNAEFERNMEMLQTEGYGYGEETKDNTPYMKGDEYDI